MRPFASPKIPASDMLLSVVIPKEGGWKLFTPDLPESGLWYHELQDAIDYAKAEPSLHDRTLHVFDAGGDISFSVPILVPRYGGESIPPNAPSPPITL